MRFSTISASAILATVASAAAVEPAPQPITSETVFELLSLRSASDVHFRWVNAVEDRLWLHREAETGAGCDRPTDGNAQFRLIDGNLFLYSTSYPQQQMWCDRSGMGQGITGYTTGVQPLPSRNGERGPWVVDGNNTLTMQFSNGFYACPQDKFYRIWTDSGVTSPGQSEGCLFVTLRAVPVSQPNSCLYSSAPVPPSS